MKKKKKRVAKSSNSNVNNNLRKLSGMLKDDSLIAVSTAVNEIISESIISLIPNLIKYMNAIKWSMNDWNKNDANFGLVRQIIQFINRTHNTSFVLSDKQNDIREFSQILVSINELNIK